jgi:hypothetical protein
MAKAGWLTFAVCLLAIVWLTAPRATFAGEAPAKSEHQAAPEGKGEGAKQDHGKGDHGKDDHGKGEGAAARDPNSPQPKASESDRTDAHADTRTDTHLDTDAPRLPPRRDDDRSQRVKPKAFPDGTARLHHAPAAAPVLAPVARNAIGVIIPPREALPHSDAHAGVQLHLPAQAPAASLTVAPLAAAKALLGPGTSRMPHAIVAPSITVPTGRGGAISGTGLPHHGTGPSQIGGPAKSVAVISGTAIRAKR